MDSEQPGPLDKRRKIRKGTHSCWECKRRKVRCTYASPAHSVCIGCTRRCTECVSQEFPERTAPPASRSRLVGDRIVRVEAMIERLAQQSGRGSPSSRKPDKDIDPNHGVLTPTSCDTPAFPSASSYSPSVDEVSPDVTLEHCSLASGQCTDISPKEKMTVTSGHGYRALSEALLAVYPSQREVDILLDMGGKVSTYTIQILTRSYREIQEEQIDGDELLRTRPTAETHPILIAKQMFILAIAIQYINPEIPLEGSGLADLPRVTMQRIGNTASNLIMTNNEMVCAGTIEGLECLLLEGLYQANSGNLRRAWMTWRRGIAVAQLMGLPHLHRAALKSVEPTYTVDPQFVWFRMLFMDRFLSLFLGLPQASLDKTMGSQAALRGGTAQDKLERIHCTIVSKILERNDRDPSADDFLHTQAIDAELQEAASTMPSRWWLTPNWANAHDDSELFWEITRLQSQIVHYNLLNLLHLPYILHSPSDPEHRRYDYSRITCVNASRDVLKCYILFRSFNRIAYCCRVVDYFALMASLTLLLTHLNGHSTSKYPTDNVFAHQRLSDRGMVEQALENMDLVANLNEDALSATSARLLRQLLKVEADSALGSRHKLGRDTGELNHARGVLRVHVPYMGSIIIEREGESREELQDQPNTSTTLPPPTSISVSGNTQEVRPKVFNLVREKATMFSEDSAELSQPHPSAISGHVDDLGQPARVMHNLDMADTSECQPSAMELFNDYNPSQSPYPSLTAGVDQWAFQGVDMAFFNRLMRGVDTQLDNEANGW